MAIIDYEETWDDSRTIEIETRLLQGVFASRTTEAVEAAVTYAKYLSTVGITPENYPVFLKMLEIENHWVVDALIGNRDPFLLLSILVSKMRPGFNVLIDRHTGKHERDLKGSSDSLLTDTMGSQTIDPLPAKNNLTATWIRTGNHIEESRLPCTVGSGNTEYFPFFNLKT